MQFFNAVIFSRDISNIEEVINNYFPNIVNYIPLSITARPMKKKLFNIRIQAFITIDNELVDLDQIPWLGFIDDDAMCKKIFKALLKEHLNIAEQKGYYTTIVKYYL